MLHFPENTEKVPSNVELLTLERLSVKWIEQRIKTISNCISCIVNPVYNKIHIILHFLTIFIYSQTTWMSLLIAFMSFLRFIISFLTLFILFSWSLLEFLFSLSRLFSDKIFITFLNTQGGKLKWAIQFIRSILLYCYLYLVDTFSWALFLTKTWFVLFG